MKKNNFEYWANNSAAKFLIFYWSQYIFLYLLALWLAVRTSNPFIFLIVGVCPYFVILCFRAVHSPFSNLEEGIKEYNPELHERLKAKIPDKYTSIPKYRAGFMFSLLLKEPESNLNSKLLAFKKNYYGINKHAMISLFLWFITFFALGAYLYIHHITPASTPTRVNSKWFLAYALRPHGSCVDVMHSSTGNPQQLQFLESVDLSVLPAK